MTFSRRPRKIHEIAPDEIFLESSNLPGRDDPHIEARVVKPISDRAISGVGVAFAIALFVFAARSFDLGIVHGATYSEVSRENRLERSVAFAVRGEIFDRAGRKLAWNEARPDDARELGGVSAESTAPIALRRYLDVPGLSLLLGFVRYPRADANGKWWREETVGVSGVELSFDELLAGKNGSTMVEVDARGNVQEQSIVTRPENGTDITLSIDAEVQSALFSFLSAHVRRQGFVGGAAAIMDVETGELLALTSFPEDDNTAFTAGDAAAVRASANDRRTPLLNRAVSGLYTPGSIVKAIFAAAALNEDVITPETKIRSTGAITIPNPYDPERPSVYRDWAVHGLINMREALAVSSDEYFYTIGGGYGSQEGLGIERLDEYARRFGLGEKSGIALLGEEEGVIPTPLWKAATFGAEDPWRIGNTYHTAIGQYGFQITPLQAVRFVTAVANGGKLLTPQVVASLTPRYTSVGIPDSYLAVVRDGMRLAVTSQRKDATVKILNMPGIAIAAKTGTAQIGEKNEWINSWSVGFWPAENPRFAYAAVLERAPAGTLSGAAPGLRPFFEWLVANKPEYIH